jgi:hypothetical protein
MLWPKRHQGRSNHGNTPSLGCGHSTPQAFRFARASGFPTSSSVVVVVVNRYSTTM